MKNLISVICAAALGSLMICANAAEPFQPLTKLRPSMTLKLYPEGQNVDKGIVENGQAITLGPGESNGITGEETMPENGNIGRSNTGNTGGLSKVLRTNTRKFFSGFEP